MTDDEFMNYQEKLDVDNISPDIEKAILDEIFRRSNTSIDPQEKFIKDMMQEISIIDWMEQRVGTVWRNKVTDKKYTETQQKAVDKRRERAIETIQEELWIDQNEAYDKYLELQIKYKAIPGVIKRMKAEILCNQELGKDENDYKRLEQEVEQNIEISSNKDMIRELRRKREEELNKNK